MSIARTHPRSPAVATAWWFVRRHRIAFGALGAYLGLLWFTDLLVVPGAGASFATGAAPDASERFAAAVLVPATILAYYFLAAFSFGLSGDLAGRRSMYPATWFTLPVSTTALVAWPMALGGVTIGVLIASAVVFGVRPSGIEFPVAWPAALALVMVAWVQALTWLPYPARGLRVIAAVLWLAMFDALAFIAMERNVAERVMLALLVPQLPIAFVVARFAVARARRGDLPDWGRVFSWGREVRRARGAEPPFRSPGHAQAWLEWRQHGWTLPGWVAILLPFELALLFVAGADSPVLVKYTLLGVLATPPLVAAFNAPRVRAPGGPARDALRLPAYVATKPVSSAALVAAKLRMTTASTLVTWVVVLAATGTALAWSGTWSVVADSVRRLADIVGEPRAVAAAALLVAASIGWTWRVLAQGLYVGLSGRTWALRVSAGVAFTLLVFAEPTLARIRDDDDLRIAIWNALAWAPFVLVALRLPIAAAVAWRLRRDGVITGASLVACAASWLAAVLALYGVLAWLVATPLTAHYWLLLVSSLAVPLVRLGAAPLALARNRHA